MSLNLNKHLIKISGIVAFVVVISGCQTINDFPKETNIKRFLAVESTFTTREEEQKVRVSYTAFLSDSASSTPIENAEVSIVSDQGEFIRFDYFENGWYISSNPCAAVEGRKYTLQIKTDSLIVTSTSGTEPVRNIETLYYKPLKNNTAFHVFANAGSVDPKNVKYYMCQMYVNDSLITSGSQIWAISDKYLTTLNNFELPWDVHHGDTVDVELQTLTQGAYDYYLTFSKEMQGSGLSYLYYKTNPPTMFNTFVLGYFQVSAVSRKRIVIE